MEKNAQGTPQPGTPPAACVPPDLAAVGAVPVPLGPAFDDARRWSLELARAGDDEARRAACHDNMMRALRDALAHGGAP